MTMQEKEQFLRSEYSRRLSTLDPATPPKWGKMNVQQMIEHMAEYIRMGYGEPEYTATITPEEHLPKMQAFVMSEKPFRENTPNSLLPDVPPPAQHSTVADSITELRDAVSTLFSRFGEQPALTVMNPFFGRLNYEMTVSLLHKHAWHHLKQFGVAE